jgi:hypothetical protein
LKIRAADAVFYLLINLIGLTARFEVVGWENHEKAQENGGLPIYVFWHDRIFLTTYWWRKRRIVVMTSRSFDGEYIARFIQRFGYGAVRGSSTRGGVGAIVEMARLMRAGCTTAFTIDGPKGPALRRENGRRVAGEKVRSSDHAGHDGAGSLLDDAELGSFPDSEAVYARSRLRSAAHLRPGGRRRKSSGRQTRRIAANSGRLESSERRVAQISPFKNLCNLWMKGIELMRLIIALFFVLFCLFVNAQLKPPTESAMDRFLRYVKIDTQSQEDQTTTPSTRKQLNLANLLAKELTALGAQNVRVSEFGIVYATVPGILRTTPKCRWSASSHTWTRRPPSPVKTSTRSFTKTTRAATSLPKDPTQVITVEKNPGAQGADRRRHHHCRWHHAAWF